MSELIVAASAVAALATGRTATWCFQKCRKARTKAECAGARADGLSRQLAAAEGLLRDLTESTLPAMVANAASGRPADVGIRVPAVPEPLQDTTLAARMEELAARLAASVNRVRTDVQLAADQQITHLSAAANGQVAAAQRTAWTEIERIRSAADVAIAEAQGKSLESTRAVIRSLASGVIVQAARLTQAVREGVRRHQGDDAYASFVDLDHLAQQLLLVTQGHGILAGDWPSRHHPTTSITEVIRAAMGRIQGYTRVQHQEMDLAVESHVVEPVIHALAALLDNALQWSPPTANVYVSVEQGHHACLIHVDDAGLRMNDETLLWVRRLMSGELCEDITQLGAEPKTGLRVVALLAGRYGFRVEVIAPNRYQGTRATLVLPMNLVVKPAPLPAAPAPSAVAAASTEGGSSGAPEVAPTAETTASGLSVRQKRAPGRTPAVAVPAGPVEPGSPGVAAAWAAGTQRGREEADRLHSGQGD